MNEHKHLSEVERLAAERGVMLTPADRAKIAAAQESELRRLQSLDAGRKFDLVRWWNDLYPKALAAIVSAGETLITIAQTLLVSLGVPITLVLLLVVEHQRVMHGIQLFETNIDLANFAAAVLVLANLVLEIQIHHVEHKAGYTAEREMRWSFRIFWHNLLYRLGWGDHWQEQRLSPAERYRRALQLVTFTILALALAGSMKDVIAGQTGAWYEAAGNVLMRSNLTQMMTWLGGLLFAGAAVITAQVFSRYVAIRTAEIVASMRTADATNPHAAALDAVGANTALAIIQEKAAKAAARKSVQAAPVEVGDQHRPLQSPGALPTPAISTNGNGRHSITE